MAQKPINQMTDEELARVIGVVDLRDLSDADLDRLHGPVGLPIGSKSPPEIALAIMADITARRNGVELVRKTPPGEPSASCAVAGQ